MKHSQDISSKSLEVLLLMAPKESQEKPFPGVAFFIDPCDVEEEDGSIGKTWQ